MPDNTLTWAEVAARLTPARTYWLGTTTPSGAPHAAPVWGAVTGGTLCLYSERSTVKARNIAADPRVIVHLESGEDVLIVRGAADDLGPPAQVPDVVSALAAKYTRPQDRAYLPSEDPDFDVVYAIRPQSAMAWRLDDYAASQRRWSAGGSECRYGATMAYPLVRGAHLATNALHSLIYFVPETEQQLTSAGLRPGRMCYFAGRAAPMGAVSAGVVTATFYNFSPDLIARFIPRAWELVRPDVVIDARFAAADAALTRLLGPDVIASQDMITLAELTREATAGCRPEGRPLYAGHASLDWPSAPHLVMWHALSLLREHRGDGHICALVAAELSGLEALITHTATGQGFLTEFAQASRGWSPEEWKSAAEALTARGLLSADGALTPAGEALRARVEEETDRLASAPWQHLGDERTEEVVRIGRAMTRAVMKAGAFPREGVFAR